MIVEQIQSHSEVRFCFIDAAQAFCQVPLDDCLAFADFIVAGSHKWMGAYLPTGIGLFGQRRSCEIIDQRVRRRSQTASEGDPLLKFTEQLTKGALDGHSETTNLTSLFTCAGAASYQNILKASPPVTENLLVDERLAQVPRPTSDWLPRQPNESFRSRIVIFELPSSSARPVCPEETRRAWLASACIVTGYPDGRARVSLPQ
jgi:hypothetical protein